MEFLNKPNSSFDIKSIVMVHSAVDISLNGVYEDFRKSLFSDDNLQDVSHLVDTGKTDVQKVLLYKNYDDSLNG